MPELHGDVTRVLREGVWMDGFEERRPGVLGGWIDAAGTFWVSRSTSTAPCAWAST